MQNRLIINTQLLIPQTVLCIIEFIRRFRSLRNITDSSIEISWGPVDANEKLFAFMKKNVMDVFGEVTCLVVDIRKSLSVEEEDAIQLSIFQKIH